MVDKVIEKKLLHLFNNFYSYVCAITVALVVF